MLDHEQVTSLQINDERRANRRRHTLTKCRQKARQREIHTLKVMKSDDEMYSLQWSTVQHHASKGKRTSNSFPVFSQSWEAFCLIIDGWMPDDVARLQKKGVCVSIDKFFWNIKASHILSLSSSTIERGRPCQRRDPLQANVCTPHSLFLFVCANVNEPASRAYIFRVLKDPETSKPLIQNGPKIAWKRFLDIQTVHLEWSQDFVRSISRFCRNRPEIFRVFIPNSRADRGTFFPRDVLCVLLTCENDSKTSRACMPKGRMLILLLSMYSSRSDVWNLGKHLSGRSSIRLFRTLKVCNDYKISIEWDCDRLQTLLMRHFDTIHGEAPAAQKYRARQAVQTYRARQATWISAGHRQTKIEKDVDLKKNLSWQIRQILI